MGEEAAAGADAAPAPRQEHEPSPYLAGEVVGDRYRLVHEIGRGGMGVVWVAHSLVLGVDVALKLIRASAASSALSSRMAREAHAAARLGHPALVRVFDFGWTRHGDPYLVMELVQGETLAAMLKREARIPAIRAVQTLLPIVDGLRMAHDKGIVHRDIKPDNVFLATDALGRRQPKLLDFGIAKVDKQVDGRLTQVGAVLGSPDYMSPEQALGLDDIDERTDIWSLCVVMYELVTGALPFQKPNYNALMHAIINEDPTSSLERGAGDKSLWDVIRRGLRKQREDRFQSATELGEAMALWLYEHGVKEDLSGNSIRAVWLDAALSGDHGAGGAPRVYHSSAAPRQDHSRPPAMMSPTTGSGTLPTLPPPSRFGSKRGLYAAGSLVLALIAGGAAWLASAKSAVSAQPLVAAPVVAQLRAPEPVIEAAPTLPAEVVPVSAAQAKPSASASKPKPRAVAARKRGHDFGF